MNWSKIKNILILLLILANLIVGGLLVSLIGDKLYIPESAVKDVTEILSSRGVEVHEGGINVKKQSYPVYRAQMLSDKEKQAERLAKASSAFGDFDGKPVVMQVPEGISVSRTSKKKDDGTRTFSATLEGNLTVEVYAPENDTENENGLLELLRDFTPPTSDFYSDGTALAQGYELVAVEKFYKAVYDSDGYRRGRAKPGFKCYGVCNLGRGRVVMCVATIDDIVVPELTSMFYFNKEKTAVYARGRFFIGNAQKAYSVSVLDGIDIIYKMNLSEVKEIISQHDALSLVQIEGKDYYLVPSYSVIFKDKNGKMVNNIYDSVAGELKSSNNVE